MKPKLITALAVPVLLATGIMPAAAISTYEECGSRGSCIYDRNTYNKYAISDTNQTSDATESSCISNDNCWVPGYEVCMNPDMGYDEYKDDCAKNCGNLRYDVAVLGGSVGSYSNMGCACYPVTQWQPYPGKTGVLREYVRDTNPGAPCAVKTTNKLKCANNYYGTPDSNGNGCIECTGQEMYCNGDATFYCGDGWYKNATKTGCLECPSSIAGGLGYTLSGTVVYGEGGGEDITDCYFGAGSVFYDDSGTFTIVDNDCYYKK